MSEQDPSYEPEPYDPEPSKTPYFYKPTSIILAWLENLPFDHYSHLVYMTLRFSMKAEDIVYENERARIHKFNEWLEGDTDPHIVAGKALSLRSIFAHVLYCITDPLKRDSIKEYYESLLRKESTSPSMRKMASEQLSKMLSDDKKWDEAEKQWDYLCKTDLSDSYINSWLVQETVMKNRLS